MKIFSEFTEVIKKYSNILIMTHKNPDLDGIGSAICLNQIIKTFNIKCHIFLNDNLAEISVLKALDKLKKNNVDIDFVNQNEYKDILSDDTLLIITDVYKKELLEHSDILDEIENVIVIDHHRVGQNYIEHTIFKIIDQKYSSMNEMLVDYLKYLEIKVDKIVATIMLAGIEIDTSNFNLKTTKNTFLSAAFLMDCGADIILKQEILKENKEEYIKKQYFVKRSYMATDNIALCILDTHIYENKFLALLSEELLQFENVEASFTIGKISDDVVGISARSIGNIDVEKKLSKLGGGGHKTDAACQLYDTTIESVKEKLIKIIKE